MKHVQASNKKARKTSVTLYLFFIANFKHISHLFLEFLLLYLNKYMINGYFLPNPTFYIHFFRLLSTFKCHLCRTFGNHLILNIKIIYHFGHIVTLLEYKQPSKRQYWGTRQQLRAGMVIAYRIDISNGPLDPIYGVLLCPTAGTIVCWKWVKVDYILATSLRKKLSFPLRISSVNVTRFAVFCGFGHIYWSNP